MTIDKFSSTPNTQDPARRAVAITPSDTTGLDEVCRGIFTGSGGTIVVLLGGDTVAVTLTNVPAGIVLPLRVKRVNATSTTATGLIALY